MYKYKKKERNTNINNASDKYLKKIIIKGVKIKKIKRMLIIIKAEISYIIIWWNKRIVIFKAKIIKIIPKKILRSMAIKIRKTQNLKWEVLGSLKKRKNQQRKGFLTQSRN